jgi:hypothetical protein
MLLQIKKSPPKYIPEGLRLGRKKRRNLGVFLDMHTLGTAPGAPWHSLHEAVARRSPQCIIPPVDLPEKPPIPKPSEEPMTEMREDNSASRVATYFVFIFLIAAIVETLLATLGR